MVPGEEAGVGGDGGVGDLERLDLGHSGSGPEGTGPSGWHKDILAGTREIHYP